MDSGRKVRRSKSPRTKTTRPKSPSETSPPPKVLPRDVSPGGNPSDEIISIQVPDDLPASHYFETTKTVPRGSSKERRMIAEIQEQISSDSEESCVSHVSQVESVPRQYRVGDTLLYFLLHPRTIPPKTLKSSMELWWRDRWSGLVDPRDSLTINHFHHCVPSTATNLEVRDALKQAGSMLDIARLRQNFKTDPVKFAKEQTNLTSIGPGQSAKIDQEEITTKFDTVTTRLKSTAKAIIDALVLLQRDIDRQAGLSRSAMTDGEHNLKHIIDKTIGRFDDLQLTSLVQAAPVGQFRERTPEPSTSAVRRSQPPPLVRTEPPPGKKAKPVRIYSRPK